MKKSKWKKRLIFSGIIGGIILLFYFSVSIMTSVILSGMKDYLNNKVEECKISQCWEEEEEENEFTDIEDLNKTTMQLGMYKNLKVNNPTFPSFSGPEGSSKTMDKSVYGTHILGAGKSESASDTVYGEVLEINMLDYANSKEEFLRNYSELELQLTGDIDQRAVASGLTVESFGNSLVKIKLKDLKSEWSVIDQINKSSRVVHIVKDGHGNGNNNHSRQGIDYDSKIEGNIIKFRTVGWYDLHSTWGPNRDKAWVKSNFKIKSSRVISAYNVDTLKNKLINSLSTTYKFESPNSSLGSSKDREKADSTDIPLEETNYYKIQNEVENRIKKGFGDEYNSWYSKSEPILTNNIEYRDEESVVYINIKSTNTTIVPGGQFVTNIKMPLDITVDPNYSKIAARKRFKILPGMITNSENKLVYDIPEYNLETQTYTYHTRLKLQYSSQRDKNEILLVNNNPTEVYQDMFYTTLLDARGTDLSLGEATKYTVEVKSDDLEAPLKFNIEIDSMLPSLDMKWQGWKPDKDAPVGTSEYNQYLLTQKYLSDGTENPAYDPTIDATTGTRKEYLFISNPGTELNGIAYDPLDQYGNRLTNDPIKYPVDPSDPRIIKGYFFEGIVANRGIVHNIGKNFNKRVEKVERRKFDPKTGIASESAKEILTPEKLEKEPQFSTPGYWLYDIIIKDKVEEPIDPSENPIKDVTAVGGTHLQKIVRISNDVEAYSQFSKLPEILGNSMYKDMYESTPGKHLKMYLSEFRKLTSSMLLNLTYEQRMMYWKEYQNDQYQQIAPVPKDPVNYLELSDMSISSLKMNLPGDTENFDTFIRNNIKKYIKEEIERNILEMNNGEEVEIDLIPVLGVDYEIITSLGMNINNELFDGLKTSENKPRAEMGFKVKAKSNSILVGGTSGGFKVINDVNYDPDKVLNLANIPWEDYKYNFTSSVEEGTITTKSFIEEYIFNNITSYFEIYKPEIYEGEYVYGGDYIITLQGVGGQSFIKFKLGENGLPIWNSDLLKYELEYDENNNPVYFEEYVRQIDKFLNSKNKETIQVTIASMDNTLLMENYGMYRLINDPNSGEIAPPKPPVKEKNKLSDFLTNTHLGVIKNNSKVNILQAVKLINPSLDSKTLKVKSGSVTLKSAIIYSPTYEGEVMVTFDIKEDENGNTPDPTDPEEGGNENNGGNEGQFNKANLWWIIPLVFISIVGIIIVIWKFRLKKKKNIV